MTSNTRLQPEIFSSPCILLLLPFQLLVLETTLLEEILRDFSEHSCFSLEWQSFHTLWETSSTFLVKVKAIQHLLMMVTILQSFSVSSSPSTTTSSWRKDSKRGSKHISITDGNTISCKLSEMMQIFLSSTNYQKR